MGGTCFICPEVEKPPLNSFRANENLLCDCLGEHCSLQIYRFGGRSTCVSAADKNEDEAEAKQGGGCIGFQSRLTSSHHSSFGGETSPGVRGSLMAHFSDAAWWFRHWLKKEHKQPNAYESREENVHQLGAFII